MSKRHNHEAWSYTQRELKRNNVREAIEISNAKVASADQTVIPAERQRNRIAMRSMSIKLWSGYFEIDRQERGSNNPTRIFLEAYLFTFQNASCLIAQSLGFETCSRTKT